MKKYTPLSIIYDFDGTLVPGNMQELAFIPDIGMTKTEFWREVSLKSKEHNADNILIYMLLMIQKANAAAVPVKLEDFLERGRSLTFFDGILPYSETGIDYEGWFSRINTYGKSSRVKVDHYILSSGNKEIIDGSLVAKEFKKIFASSFYFNHNDVAEWPALAINYTTKTQFLFRINKGCLDVDDNNTVNKFIPHNERKVPFQNMIYIGDGDTDVPCFRLVKERGGYSIIVFKPNTRGAKNKAIKITEGDRVNLITPADYREGKQLEVAIKAIIDKIDIDARLKKHLLI